MQAGESVLEFFLWVRTDSGQKEIHVVHILVTCVAVAWHQRSDRHTCCLSAGCPMNLKRICICSVIYQMMQYTAMIQRTTSLTPRRKTCTLCQIHDRTHRVCRLQLCSMCSLLVVWMGIFARLLLLDPADLKTKYIFTPKCAAIFLSICFTVVCAVESNHWPLITEGLGKE